MRVLPASYYPTMTMFVDDNMGFLKSVDNMLKFRKDVHYRLFNSPVDAVDFLNQHHSKETWLQQCLTKASGKDESGRVMQGVELDISKLRNRALDPNRFNEVSMVFMDEKMPEGSGREFLTKIQNMSIKCGILSGVMKYGEAIDSFNREEVDVFLSKLDKETPEQLMKYIERAHQDYFTKLSPVITKYEPKLAKVLANQDFVKFFLEILDKNNIVEFYLIDKTGSYLLLDANGDAKILAVTNDDDLESYHVTAKLADKKPSPIVLEALNNKTKFPFFCNVTEEDIEPEDWERFLVAATELKGNGIYYCLIDDISPYNLKLNGIKSYTEFREKNRESLIV